VKKEALHIINHCFSGSACIDVKGATNDPKRNRVYGSCKTRSSLSQATTPKKMGDRQLYKFSVPEKVLLQAVVKSDKSPSITPQETLLKSFCGLCLLRWLSNWDMDLWSFPCWHNISDADHAKDNLIVSRTRKWCNL